ncbi:MAG TPA: hypothetical protein VNV63_01235 [Nitrospiria bacterium]|nr:hypothetical protein [Nitrospiria bacterium]
MKREQRKKKDRRDESEDRRAKERRKAERRSHDRREGNRRLEICPTCGRVLTPSGYCSNCKVRVIKIRNSA